MSNFWPVKTLLSPPFPPKKSVENFKSLILLSHPRDRCKFKVPQGPIQLSLPIFLGGGRGGLFHDCPLKGHTCLNKSAAKSCRFVSVRVHFGGKHALKINRVKKEENLQDLFPNFPSGITGI